MKKKPIAKRAPKRGGAKPTTALARRKHLTVPVDLLPANHPLPEQGLTSLATDPVMVTHTVGTLKLEREQIQELRRPVDDEEVDWKPVKKDGPPVIPYLSHNGYRDRLDAAFGLGGWGMVPVGMPREKDSLILVLYALCVGGVPRIYTWGEQEYLAANGNMSYGDALEGAKSNAIARCGKELGIARDLWNKRYLEGLKHRTHGRRDPGARVREDLPYTVEGGRRVAKAEVVDRGAPAASDERITAPQRKRLWVIVRNSGRSELEVKRYLKDRYGIESTNDITRRDYDAIWKAIEAPGDLPKGPQQ